MSTEAPGSAHIIVVGSANQDYIVRVTAPPAPGETVLAQDLLRQPGGKGANQAVAAARLNGDVSFVASVGDDPDGTDLLRGLRSEGVDTSEVEIIDRGRTGLALVSVYDSGENAITVVPGTNFALTASRVDRTVRRLAAEAERAIVVVQAELRPQIIATALRAGVEAGARCVLNLAPYQRLPDDLLAVCDPLVLNESEATALVGRPIADPEQAAAAVRTLLGTARSVVITLGAQGACWADSGGEGHLPATPPDRVVDTTGAGDAFVGALAATLARGGGLGEATAIGVAAGTFAVRTPGAQSSYPTLADLTTERAVTGPIS
ncbi:MULTISPECIES: ribokinase [unclassified Curtobacterium]|uniref:ribokinase n=1 Tax=unclassified Curtobacterium TaxID=257496 RepID=UPI000DA8C5CF|nr:MULTISPECIES: ribokinase [unclassified Curtobacterium]PZE27140.1 ribokinase [Curtobacterium sp. MCBD17_028]PZE74758.1 ribokinase [Curtobacterium sp. MCBD17_019]PZF60339.1 ribokinase [Curtobacterium sp. MCBD17_034]PZF62769.1 ribokinase [Curtobacterium sp. MCBD17_013]PZM35024.1 ribokinase [Curtobacterium sp. MCBD17_031]